jgi:hypothetical protein
MLARRSLAPWLLGAIGLALIVAHQSATPAGARSDVEDDPGVAKVRDVALDAAKRFTLVYNVNNSGYVDVCGCKHKEVRQGSLTRRASFLGQLRASGRELLLLDGGSTFFHIEDRVKEAELAEAVRKARLIVDAYNHMGYRAVAIGAFDLAAGLDTLKELESRAKFSFLSANLADKTTGKLHFRPHMKVDVAGVRVGIIGITLDTLTKVYLGKVAPNSMLLDPIEAMRRSVDELKSDTDIIIALSHVRETKNFEIIRKVPGISLLVDPFVQFGNHHTWIKEEEWVSMLNSTLILRSDGQGARLGVVDLDFENRHPALVSGNRLDELRSYIAAGDASDEEKAELDGYAGKKDLFRFTRVSLEPHHLTDPEIDRLFKAWKDNIDPSTVAIDTSVREKFSTHDECQSCHVEQYAFWAKTPHASAYETLKKTGDEHRYDCVGCHALGYGQAFVNTREIGNFAGVQCESCHGQQPKHAAEPSDHRYGKVKRLDCVTCHNEEQTKAEFIFAQVVRQVACPSMKRDAKAIPKPTNPEPAAPSDTTDEPKLLPLPKKDG